MKKIHSFKKIKITAVLLAVLIVLCSVISVAGSTTQNSEEAPIVFNAISDFYYGSDTNQVQNGPSDWYYEYATDSSNINWNLADRFSWNNWYPNTKYYLGFLGISYQGSMQLTNYNSTEPLSPTVAYKFIAPKNGYIYIDSNDIKITTSTDNKYNAQIRITKNNVNVYPESGYKTIEVGTTFNLENVGFEVSENDVIRFEIKSDTALAKDDKLHTYWNPIFYLRPQKNLYSGEGIFAKLSSFMSGIFSSAASSNLDNDATDTVKEAEAASKIANNGVYTVFNSIYGNNQLLQSKDDSVWKFGVETGFSPELDDNIGDFSFTAEQVETGVKITPENPDNENIYTVVAVDSNGETKSYVGKNSSLIIPFDDITLPFKVQVKYGIKASKIISLSTNCTATEFVPKSSKILLTSHSEDTAGSIRVSGTDAQSSYTLYYSRENGSAERTIEFNAVKGEKMRFGFTAPYSGQYEITAPISVDGDSEVYYSTTLEHIVSNGVDSRVLTPLTKYTGSDNLCESQAYVTKGDTIWFEAYALEDCVIDIGIPQIIHKRLDDSNGINYGYVATDYAENKTGNGYTYAAYTGAENVKAAWSFGYFDTEARTLKPYKLLKDGFYYITASGANENTAGTLYPTDGINLNDTEKPLYNRSKFYGTVDADTGIYMQFTAPIGANGTLALTDGTNAITNVKVTVMNGDTEVEVYENGVAAGTTIDMGVLSPRDTVTIMYESLDSSSVKNRYLGSPVMTLGGSISTIKFKNSAGKALYYVRASKLEMPGVQSFSGLNFVAWIKDSSQESFSPGDTYSATGLVGTNFTAQYRYYGDINLDGEITDTDFEKVSNIILGKETDVSNCADIKTDGNVNVADLLRMQKFVLLGSYSCD